MNDRFTELLHDLGKALDLTIHPDEKGMCQLRIRGNLSLQIQIEPLDDRVLIVLPLPELPPGRYRQDVLKEALKANLQLPATLAYLAAQNRLVLFQHEPIELLNGPLLAARLITLHEIGLAWQKAIQEGRAGPSPVSSSAPRPFGL